MNRHVVTNPKLKAEFKGEGIDLQDLAAFYIKTGINNNQIPLNTASRYKVKLNNYTYIKFFFVISKHKKYLGIT